MERMNVWMVSPEVVPFSKTGGLADVAGALPGALARLGHTVKIVTPLYASVDRDAFDLAPREGVPSNLSLKVGDRRFSWGCLSSGSGADGVEYLFLVNDELFGRTGLYIDPTTGKDYPDNDERFIFFARAALELARIIGFKPDICHVHDWQAAICTAYLKVALKDDPHFRETRSVFTLHNVGYQGNFPQATFAKLGLPTELFQPGSPFEYWGGINFMKTGISLADLITTVSPTYAQEIQTSEEFGFGMEGVLRNRRSDLVGVLNGVDYEVWSPEKDQLLPFNYSSQKLSGKEKNKRDLLNQAGLPISKSNFPLIGTISRLADQKGFDLIAKVAEQLFELDLYYVLLGTGDQQYHELFTELEQKYPRKLRVYLKYDNKLAHLIEAGADMFLMPSRYEPCGLNQMYSLKYGTVPIVRETGGLADTIVDYDRNPAEGNGFSFREYTGAALMDAIQRALAAYESPQIWTDLQQRGMAADFSWEASAGRYVELYKRALAQVPQLK